jgi:type II secretory pathway component GspD/PulD (secretin)
VIDPLLCCVAGQEAVHSDQLQYPLENTTTNAQTGQAQSSVQFVPVGLKLSMNCSSVRPEVVRVLMQIEDGNVQGEVNDLPKINKRLFSSTYDLPLGKTVLVGSMRRQENVQTRARWLQWGQRSEQQSAVWVVFCRVVQITA